jgi:DNA repair protein SbcC/Rad50
MRILAVRGRNLHSLREFDLRFDEPPLGGAGLVLICGPTGSGKSTLLDAICLALYGRTSRLARGGLVGAILRGEREAFVAVEFEAQGRRFEASWLARLPRKRKAGAPEEIGTPARTLRSLDDASTSEEGTHQVEALVPRLVGLDYDGFVRAVLLAQGDFAAFLKADQNDRSELLERLVGATIYRRLSVKAFQKARDARAAVAEYENALRAIAVPPEGETAALELELQELGLRSKALAAEVETARAQVAWFERETLLLDQVGAAVAEMETAVLAREAQGMLEEALGRAERAEPLRSDLEAVEAARRRLDAARAAKEEAVRALSLALARRDAVVGLEAKTGALLASVEEAARLRQPEMDRAVALDERLVREERAHLALVRSSEQATMEAALARRSFEEAEAARSEVERDLALESDFEATSRGLFELADHRDELRVRIDAWGSEIGGRASLEEAERGIAAEEQEARRASLDADRSLRSATVVVENRDREAASADTALASLLQDRSPAEIRAENQRLLERKPFLVGLRASLAERDRAAREIAAQKAGFGLLLEQDAAIDAGLQTMAAELALAEEEAGLTRKVMNGLDAQFALAARRPDLIAGEECPLCGSREHPFAGRPAPGQERVDAARQAWNRAETDRRRRAEALAACKAEKRALSLRMEAERQREDLAREMFRAAEVGVDRADALASWDGERDIARVDAAIADAENRGARLAAFVSRIEAAGKAAADAAAARSAAEMGVAAERSRSEVARARLDAVLARRAQTVRNLEEARHRARTTAASLEAKMRPAGEEVVPFFESEDPAGLEALLFRRSSEVLARREKRTSLEGRLRDLDRSLGGLGAKVQVAASRSAEEGSRRDAAASALGASKAERARLFGNRAVTALRDESERALSDARNAAESAALAARDLSSELAGLAERAAAGERAEAEAEGELSHRAQGLAHAVANAGLTAAEEALAALWPPERRNTARKQVSQAEKRAHEAEAIRASRQAELLAHEPGRMPGSEVVARSALQAATTASQDLLGRIGASRQRLLDLTEQAAHAAELRNALEARRRILDRQAPLGDLIGSADGASFARFAQGLTLEHLLARANRHLLALRPRYALDRAREGDRGGDVERRHVLDIMVVDRHMAEERRAVATLSGGESFLVSLALALGLADLARGGKLGNVRIGSLFLDEGFGSLDPESLEIAMDALDALQAQGRQVFVVSHLLALRERLALRVEVLPQGGGTSRVVVHGEQSSVAGGVPA